MEERLAVLSNGLRGREFRESKQLFFDTIKSVAFHEILYFLEIINVLGAKIDFVVILLENILSSPDLLIINRKFLHFLDSILQLL